MLHVKQRSCKNDVRRVSNTCNLQCEPPKLQVYEVVLLLQNFIHSILTNLLPLVRGNSPIDCNINFLSFIFLFEILVTGKLCISLLASSANTFLEVDIDF